MLHYHPQPKAILIEKYRECLNSLKQLMSVSLLAEEKQEENNLSYFINILQEDLTNAILEAGISILNNLIKLKTACSQYPNTPENQAIFKQSLYLAQHLFNKAKEEDIKTYQVTPAHAQLLAFNKTLEAATMLINKPNVKNGKKLDRSLKILRKTIDEEYSPIVNRLLYGLTGALLVFLGIAIIASTLSLLLISPLSITGISTVASVILGGISGTLISSGIQLLRMAFPQKPPRTPQQSALLDCANTSIKQLYRLAKNPAAFFKSPQPHSADLTSQRAATPLPLAV